MTHNISGHHPILQLQAMLHLIQEIESKACPLPLVHLRSQLLLLLWRFPETDLRVLCTRFYLSPKKVGVNLAYLARHSLISCRATTKVPKTLIDRPWQVSKKAQKIVKNLLRSEEKFNHAVAENGRTFVSHWCFDLQNINSALARQNTKAPK